MTPHDRLVHFLREMLTQPVLWKNTINQLKGAFTCLQLTNWFVKEEEQALKSQRPQPSVRDGTL